MHKGTSYPGEHDRIIDQKTWDRVHNVLAKNGHARGNVTRASTPAPLRGLIRCAHCGKAMTPSHTRRRGRLYRYYVCTGSIKCGADSCPVRSVAAGDIERLVLEQVCRLLRSPEIVSRTVAAYHDVAGDQDTAAEREREVLEAFGRLDEVWDELFPAEQARIVQLLVERIEVDPDGIDVHLRTAGLRGLAEELNPSTVGPAEDAAA